LAVRTHALVLSDQQILESEEVDVTVEIAPGPKHDVLLEPVACTQLKLLVNEVENHEQKK
jgi:hypothetical protein